MKARLPDWTEGIENTLKRGNAYLPDKYSWHAIDENGRFIFITEADHVNKNSSIVKLKEGCIERCIEPASKDWHAPTIRHANEVLSAVKWAFKNKLPVRVMLTRNSRYSQTPDKPTKANLLPWEYRVTELHGDTIEEGFSYRLEQICRS